MGNAVIRIRGQGMEKPPAVSLIEVNEVIRQRALGRVPVREAIDKLYKSIDTLRHGVTAAPSRIQFLGRGEHNNKALVVMFDESTAIQLTDERMQMLQTLEGLAEAPYEFSWLSHKRPHISLARMPASQIEKATAEVWDKMEQSLPPTVVLDRATLHNPSSHGN